MPSADNFFALQKTGRKSGPSAGFRRKANPSSRSDLGPARKIRAAIFDLDGTLISSEKIYLRAWQAAAKDCQRCLTRALYLRLLGLNAAATITALASEWKSTAEAEQFIEKADQHYARLVRRHGHTIRPGILTLLKCLTARRLRLAVATSSARKLALDTLAATGLDKYFDYLVGGDEIKRGKPDPQIYRLAAARLKVPPAACIAFEDSPIGLAAATSAGMFTIVVPELRLPMKPPAGAWCLLRSHAQAIPLFS